MIRRFGHPRDEEGFSLAELLVSMALLGAVLAVGYAVADVVRAGQRVADRDAELARVITYPMTRMSEILIQNTRIEAALAPTPNTLSVRTDQNLDDVQEQHNFRLAVGAAGDTHIEHSSFRLNTAGARIVPAVFVHRYATGITNAADAVPLFRYFNASGVELTDMGRVPSEARSLVITIRATVDGSQVAESVTVRFRNRDE